MTYLLLDAVFIAVAALVLAVVRRRLGRGRPSLVAIGGAIVCLSALTALFDNLMIAAGLFGYAEEHLVGLSIGRAPVEDLGYPVTVALLLPAVWHLLGRRTNRRRPALVEPAER